MMSTPAFLQAPFLCTSPLTDVTKANSTHCGSFSDLSSSKHRCRAFPRTSASQTALLSNTQHRQPGAAQPESSQPCPAPTSAPAPKSLTQLLPSAAAATSLSCKSFTCFFRFLTCSSPICCHITARDFFPQNANLIQFLLCVKLPHEAPLEPSTAHGMDTQPTPATSCALSVALLHPFSLLTFHSHATGFSTCWMLSLFS